MKRLFGILLGTVLGCAAIDGAHAQWTTGEVGFALLPPPSPPLLVPIGPDCQNWAQKEVAAGRAVPFGRLKRTVESQFGGKVVAVDCSSGGSGFLYHLKVIAGGQVKWVTVNPRNGRILDVRG